jgi:lysozyme
MMSVNDNGIELIKAFEGWRAKAYRDPVGIWTIGYGHTSMAGEPTVTAGLVITKQQGDEILRRDVALFARGVKKPLTVKLNDNQFSALVSFAYNVGLGAFKKSSVLKAVNTKNFDAVPSRLKLWNKAGYRVLPGLVRRRQAESDLFMLPPKKTVQSDSEAREQSYRTDDPVLVPKPARPEVEGGGIAAGGGAAVVVTAAASGWPWWVVGGLAVAAIVIAVGIYVAIKKGKQS